MYVYLINKHESILKSLVFHDTAQQVTLVNFGCRTSAVFRPFGLPAPRLFGFSIFWLWAYPMKVIPETSVGALSHISILCI